MADSTEQEDVVRQLRKIRERWEVLWRKGGPSLLNPVEAQSLIYAADLLERLDGAAEGETVEVTETPRSPATAEVEQEATRLLDRLLIEIDRYEVHGPKLSPVKIEAREFLARTPATKDTGGAG